MPLRSPVPLVLLLVEFQLTDASSYAFDLISNRLVAILSFLPELALVHVYNSPVVFVIRHDLNGISTSCKEESTRSLKGIRLRKNSLSLLGCDSGLLTRDSV